MRKLFHSQSGIFNPRVFLTFALCTAGALLAVLSFAATPPDGTLSPTNLVVTWTGGPYVIPSTSGDTCDAPDECDEFALTVQLPADYATTNPNAKIRMEI